MSGGPAKPADGPEDRPSRERAAPRGRVEDRTDPDGHHACTAMAIATMRRNDRGAYTVPTAGLYPYQWNWDSAFAALGFARFDLDRAWRELETLMAAQWPDGMVPHILFHAPDDSYFPGPDVWDAPGPVPSSGITQPPVAMTVLRRLHAVDPGADRVGPLFDGMVRWAAWFLRHRADQGAIFVTHPWESGRDNAPDWDGAMAGIDPVGIGPYTRRDTSHVDPAMRPTTADYDRYVWLVQWGRARGWDAEAMRGRQPFRVAEPTTTFILLRGLRDLVELGRALGRDVADLTGMACAVEAGAATLWNPETACYDARDVRSGFFAGAVTSAAFLCWYAGVGRPEMLDHLRRVLDAAPHGVPSLDPADPRFDARRYWRGPVWPFMNQMIGTGLSEAGLPEGARLRATTRALLSASGMAEYYDPSDGAPMGGLAFTWPAAVWLSWAGDVAAPAPGGDS